MSAVLFYDYCADLNMTASSQTDNISDSCESCLHSAAIWGALISETLLLTVYKYFNQEKSPASPNLTYRFVV